MSGRLAVWGDPIEHSRSPDIHAAAYATLGLDWKYDRRRVGAEDFDGHLTSLGPEWRGLALTMPLKERAYAAATARDSHAMCTGAVNTLVLGGKDGPHGFNTDVGGIVRGISAQRMEEIAVARIVGAGSTAASAVVALGELGARHIDVVARRPERAGSLVALGESLGVRVVPSSVDGSAFEPAQITIATLPGGTILPEAVVDALAERGGMLLDAAYAPWPSQLARAWPRENGEPLSGLVMLLHQALLQVRIFVSGDVDIPLHDEAAVFAAMRATLMGD